MIRIRTRQGVMGHKIKQFSILPHEEANSKMRYGEFRFKLWLNMFCIFSKRFKVMFFILGLFYIQVRVIVYWFVDEIPEIKY